MKPHRIVEHLGGDQYRVTFRDPREVEREYLWPDRFGEVEIAELKNNLRQFAEAQLQQNPTPSTGGIIKMDWIHYWSPGGQVPDTVALPPIGYDVISWDCSFKGKETSDPSCGIVIRRAGGKFYVTDCEWGRWGFEELLEAATRLCLRNPRVIHKLVEGKANGPAVVSMLQSRFPGFEEVEPDGGKEARANAVAPLFKAGTVFFPHPSVATWTNPAVLELIRFPRGSHDDMVDAVSQGLLYLYLHGSKLGDLIAAASTNPIIQQVLKSRNGG